MKRFLSITLAILLVCAFAAGCRRSGSSDSNPAGRYGIAKVNGQSLEEYVRSLGVEPAQFLQTYNLRSLDELFAIELKADGTVVYSEAAGAYSETGTWERQGGKVMITIDNLTREATLKNGELSLDLGDGVMTFRKR
ncbi:MAG: hypothetical protein IKQ92_03060 [Clostridia bacterium]|nr:hypothetical protein [Clostridia bacterium]